MAHNFAHVSSLPHTGSDQPDTRDIANRVRSELGAPSHIRKEMEHLLSPSKPGGANSAVSFLKDLYSQRYHKENLEGPLGHTPYSTPHTLHAR